MNAAARFLSQSTVSPTWVVSVLLSRVQYSVYVFAVGILVSSLSLIYVTNMTRGFKSEVSQAEMEKQNLHIQWSQLLLEKGTWTTQARVQKVAQDKLDMVMPTQQTVVIVNE